MESVSFNLLLIFHIHTLLHQLVPVLCVGHELYEGDEFTSIPPQTAWCYGRSTRCGEHYWPFLTESFSCSHNFQSPINLPSSTRRLTKHSKTKKTHYLQKESYILSSFTITNTGRTLQIRPYYDWVSGQDSGALTVVINKQTYFFHSLHFHWGSKDDIGSEHAIGGKSFPIEVHLVYYSGEYRHIKYPLTHWSKERGLVVIAVFMESDLINPAPDSELHFHSYSNVLFPVVSTFKHLKYEQSKTSFGPFILRELFQGERQVAYKYEGSMTTPPCRENVLWFVIRNPIIVPIWHIRAFRETEFYGSGKYSNNFRSLQKLSFTAKRKVNYTRDIEMITLNFNGPPT